jgi:hypothetical protein
LPGSSPCRKYYRCYRQLWRLLYATDWKRVACAAVAAFLRAFASIADIVCSHPALQLAAAVLVESSWRHGVELHGRSIRSDNFWEAPVRSAKSRGTSHSDIPHFIHPVSCQPHHTSTSHGDPSALHRARHRISQEIRP